MSDDAKISSNCASATDGPAKRFVWTPAHFAHLPPAPEPGMDEMICKMLNEFDYEKECKAAGLTRTPPPLRIKPRRRTGCPCCGNK